MNAKVMKDFIQEDSSKVYTTQVSISYNSSATVNVNFLPKAVMCLTPSLGSNDSVLVIFPSNLYSRGMMLKWAGGSTAKPMDYAEITWGTTSVTIPYSNKGLSGNVIVTVFG